MRIAVPKEILPGERRVALTPEIVRKLAASGHAITVETGAGVRAGYSDEAFRAAGAEVAASAAQCYGNAEMVIKVQRAMPSDSGGRHEAELIPEGAILIGLLRPHASADTVKLYADRGIWAFSLELVPRITRAQSMDVNSSQATVAGYKAVIMAANALPRFFPMLMTAAGTIKPATVLVIGAGVAGLQAIATARRLGAVVYAFDTRPAAREHVESLRGKFIGLELGDVKTEDAGGYARELGDDLLSHERAVIEKQLKDADVVIATAQVPGRPAPQLITDRGVSLMKYGSVIVDLAAENGGNCELSAPGKTVVRHDVTIIAPLNLPSELPTHASDMYARNIAAFIKLLVPADKAVMNMEDQIIRDSCIARPGEITHAPTREKLEAERNGIAQEAS
jgi:H+-translocating NAD(P) transhydrogenase subunit alpha